MAHSRHVLIIFSIFIVCGCKKNNPSPTPASNTPYFAFTMNGKPYTLNPKIDPNFNPPHNVHEYGYKISLVDDQYGYYVVNIEADLIGLDTIIYISTLTTNHNMIGAYPVKDQSYNKNIDILTNYAQSLLQIENRLPISGPSSGSVSISNIDFINHIISGTFQVTLIDSVSASIPKNYNITDGVFNNIIY